MDKLDTPLKDINIAVTRLGFRRRYLLTVAIWKSDIVPVTKITHVSTLC
jgi:hypothetical protein